MTRLKNAASTLLSLAILVALVSRLGLFSVSLKLPPDAIVPEKGHAYIFHIPFPELIWQVLVSGDNPSDPTLSSLILMEGDRILGPPHSLHETIRTEGMGAFSHWGAYIIFSSSDNHDPRTSGIYFAKIPLQAQLHVILGLVLLLTAINFSRLPALTIATRRRLADCPFCVAAIVILITFGATEFIAKTMVNNFDNPRSVGYLYNAYRGHELNPNDGSGLHSIDGFRSDHVINKVKPSDVFRVFVMGGSALYGIGSGGIYPSHSALPNDKTITAFLEARINAELDKRGEVRRVEIINAGVTAYETFQHLVYANETLIDYDPDLFIFVDGFNDWFRADPTYNAWKNYWYSSVMMTPYLNHPSILIGAYQFSHSLASYSNFAELLFRVLHVRVRAVFAEESKKRWERAVPQLGPNLPEAERMYAKRTFLLSYQQIATLSTSIGAQNPLVFLQPVVTFEDRNTLSEPDREIYDITSMAHPSFKSWENIRALLPGLFRSEDLEFHDIGRIGGSAEMGNQLYIDYCHLSSKGSQRVAELMYPSVMRRIESWLGGRDREN
jgi:hypothetical protein